MKLETEQEYEERMEKELDADWKAHRFDGVGWWVFVLSAFLLIIWKWGIP